MMALPLRFLLIVVSSAAYLALAVLGWGGVLAFFAHPALVALTTVFFVLVGVALFAGGNVSPGEREDRRNRWVLVAFVARWLSTSLDAGGASGPSMAMRSAGSACCCSPLAERCDSGQSSCSALASAGSWRSNPDTHWSRVASTVSSATRVSGVARERVGVGPCLSVGGRRAAHGTPDSAPGRTHQRGR